MKTYLFDTINRYKRFSENLDVSTTLCNKSWWVFNDEGVKSLYIFQPNGDLYITTNGVGLKGSWQYISANKTVIINSDNKVMMFHPAFVDDNILTLTLDGTQCCAFLIDENNRANFAPRSLYDLTRYFQAKEQKEIEAKQREEEARRRAAEERARQRRAEEQARQRAAEERARQRVYDGHSSQYGPSTRQSPEESSSDSGLNPFVKIILWAVGFVVGFEILISLSENFGWSDGTSVLVAVIFVVVIVVVAVYFESD